MKRLAKYLNLSFVVILLALFTPCNTFAQENISSLDQRVSNSVVLFIGSSNGYVNGESAPIDSGNMSVYPFIKDDRTLVPVRFISESLGANVGWNDKTSAVTISLNGICVEMTIGSNIIWVDGISKEIDVTAQTYNDRTFIPLRALVESLGKNVYWDNRGLIIISGNYTTFSDVADETLLTELVKCFNKYGNTIGNILNNGSSAQDDEWIYYINNKTLNKVKKDGTLNTVILNVDATILSNLNVVDGWIYCLKNNCIYKIKTNGTLETKVYSEEAKVYNDNIKSMIIVGDWIYYINYFNEAFKMKINGSCKSLLDSPSSCINRIENHCLSFINENGEHVWLKLNQAAGALNFAFDGGDWIYYNDPSSVTGGIYKTKLNGDEKTTIPNIVTNENVNITDGWIYYINTSDYYTLYKINTDGTENTKLNDDFSYCINIFDDWVYYLNCKTQKVYKIKTDGTQRSTIDNSVDNNSALTQEDKDNF